MIQTILTAVSSYFLGWIGYATGLVEYATPSGRIFFMLIVVALFFMVSINLRLRKLSIVLDQISSAITEAHRQAGA